MAAPYFAGFTPHDYEANRALVRRMATYLAAADYLNRDPRLRSALNDAYRSVAALQWMGIPNYQPYPGQHSPSNPQPPTQQAIAPNQPRFALQAPLLDKVPTADQATADDLSNQYEMAATKASIAWKSANVIRQNLNAQQMTLNVQTETSLARLQLYFELATGALQSKDWAEAKTNIQRAEYETEKVLKTVGR